MSRWIFIKAHLNWAPLVQCLSWMNAITYMQILTVRCCFLLMVFFSPFVLSAADTDGCQMASIGTVILSSPAH